MDLSFSPADEQYRARLRAWLEEESARLAEAGSVMSTGGDIMAALQFARDWQRTLWEAGYVGLVWPEEYGGQEASLTEQVIVAEELARVRTPPLINTIGLSILGPTLIAHGTEEQKARFLPRILTAEELWCQGFSEPEAGSDLAALRTRAVLDGDDFVVNGQKVWTSMAPIADWCFLLVRTDPDAPKREGISYLLCDMRTPGIDVQPLRNAAGGIHFSEIFFDDVRIPRENLVGELHGGWQIVRTTLANERSGLSGVLALEQNLERLRSTASRLDRGGRPVARGPLDPSGAGPAMDRDRGAPPSRLSHAERPARGWSTRGGGLGGQALRLGGAPATRPHGAADRRPVGPGDEALAPRGRPRTLDGGLLRRHRPLHRWRYGEIQRNTIAERVLGLPRSVEDDR